MSSYYGFSAYVICYFLMYDVCFFFFFVFFFIFFFFFFSSRRRHTRLTCDWSSDVCSSDLIGMTQIFDEQGIAYPVTIIEAGPCYVTQVRNQERDGYVAVQLGFGEIHPKKLAAGELGHLKANDLPPMRFLREFRSKETVNVGDKLTVDLFAIGEHVDVVGTSKGKGFAGAVKRYHFKGGKKTHG